MVVWCVYWLSVTFMLYRNNTYCLHVEIGNNSANIYNNNNNSASSSGDGCNVSCCWYTNHHLIQNELSVTPGKGSLYLQCCRAVASLLQTSIFMLLGCSQLVTNLYIHVAGL